MNIGLPGQYVGTPHLYRIEWDAAQVRFFVDGATVPVSTHNGTFGPALRPIASDFANSAVPLSVDWMRMSPYPASGTFESRVFDAGPGQSVNWGALTWDATTPLGTGGRAQRPHRRHAHARRELERLHPGRGQRRRHPGDLPLRAVPRGAHQQRPGT